MRYSRTGIIAVLLAVEVFIAGAIVVSVGGFKAFSGVASAREFDYSPSSLPVLDAGSNPHVVIDDADSHVFVTPADDGKVHVTDGTRMSGWGWGSRPAQLKVSRTGDGVLIERPATPGHTHFILFGFDSGRTEVAVPAGATVEIRNAGGTDLSDLTGTISVRSSDGHITATNVRSSDLSFTTADGRITLNNVDADKLAANTSDGSIYASDLRLRTGTVHTADGSITLAFADNGDVAMHARTADGSIRINGARQDDSSSDYKLGNGSGTLDVATQDGRIRVTTNGAN